MTMTHLINKQLLNLVTLSLVFSLYACEQTSSNTTSDPCEVGQTRCTDDYTKQTCSLNGQWDNPVACPTDYLCVFENTSASCQSTTSMGGNQPGGNQPGGNQPGGNQPGGNQPGGNQPGGNQPGGNQPGGNQPGGNQPGGNQPGGNQPGGNQPGGNQPGGNPNPQGGQMGGDPMGGAPMGGDPMGGNLDPQGGQMGGNPPPPPPPGPDTFANHCSPNRLCPSAKFNQLSLITDPNIARNLGCHEVGASLGQIFNYFFDVYPIANLNNILSNANQAYVMHLSGWPDGLTGNQVQNVDLNIYLGDYLGAQDGYYRLNPPSLIFPQTSVSQAKIITPIIDGFYLPLLIDSIQLFTPDMLGLKLSYAQIKGDLALQLQNQSFEMNNAILSAYVKKSDFDAFMMNLTLICTSYAFAVGYCDEVRRFGGLEAFRLILESVLFPDVRLDEQGNAFPCLRDDCNAFNFCMQVSSAPTNLLNCPLDFPTNQVCDAACFEADIDCNPMLICNNPNIYGNGICEEACRDVDPDCVVPPPPPVDNCQVDGLYGDGSCDVCFRADPDCNGRNPCVVQDLYNDGACDICPGNTDPDCGGRDACTENDAYGDGWCDPCPRHDPDCP